MRFKQGFIFFSLFAFQFTFLYGQAHHDHVAPMRTNPALVNYTKQVKESHKFVWRIISDSIVLELPFLDDFSHGGPYPDTAFWLDNEAYINNTYPISPHTLGVATLDGVNNAGQPYNPNCPPGASFPADSLTSRPINLSKYKDPDNVWFSFYWQAGGRGFAPLTADTLILQFRTAHTPWTTVWYQLGYSPVYPDTGFHVVMIPISDTIHNVLNPSGRINAFDGNFQFRFKNYACTSANADQWNIDEVYINEHRFAADTLQNDVTFVYESPSLLKNYEYMPWEQFTCNDLKDTMYVEERNNSSTPINLTYSYTMPTEISHFTAIANIKSGISTTYAQTHPPIKSNYNCATLAGPTDITITHLLSYVGDAIPWNDTLRFKQIFSNYYAYDDSSAEASYFVNGSAPIDLAEQFTLNHMDTLRGLELYFNYMFVNPAAYTMRLAVWDNSGPNGSPGNLVYEDDSIDSPRTSDTLNGFTYYPYHSLTPLKVSGTIYVGWIQTYGDSLNIGLDLNTNSTSKIYYNANTCCPYGWDPASIQNGSLMMRPVFGSVGFKFHLQLATSDIKTQMETLSLYPNPANNMVTLSTPMPPNTMLKIYTVDGRECISNSNFSGNSINTASLIPGFYIVQVTPQNGQTSYQKLLIQR